MPPSNKRQTLGFLLASLHTGASQALLPGLLDAAEKHDVNFICFPGGRLRAASAFENQRNVIYDLAGPESLQGLVTWSSSLGGNVGTREVNRFHQRFLPLPMVSLSHSMEGTPTVSLDSYRGMRALLNHLIEVHGYQRLAFIRGPEKHFPAQERYRAYADELQAHRLPLIPELVTHPLRWEAGAEAIEILLDERRLQPGRDFQAIVAASDLMALWALKALQKRGIDIPGDVAVTGFNSSIEEHMATPPLTTVELPFYEQGMRAVETLVTHCAGEAVPALITLPTRLRVQRSCGCPSAAVVQAGKPPDKQAVPPVSFEDPDAFEAGHAVLLHAAAQAAPSGPFQDPAWLAPICEAFWRDLEQRRAASPAGRFLALLEGVLERIVRKHGDIKPWHSVLSALRQSALAMAGPALHAPIEALIAQGRIVISEALERAQAYRQWQTERDNEALRAAILALLTAIDLQQVNDVLADYLPRLGIPGAYLALYENPAHSLEYARLVFAYTDQRRFDLEAGGQRFLSRQVVPPEYLPQQRRYSLVVEPLFFQERHFGFIAFEFGPPRGDVYELLRANLSSALQSTVLFQEIEQARLNAEKADRVKTLLLANVSHELRTPLNIILGYTNSAGQKELPETLQGDVAQIQTNAEHLLRVIDDLLDLSRAEINELDLATQLLDPHALLSNAFQSMADQNTRPEVHWRLRLPARLPLVHADPLRMRQIVLNLLSNAMKFTASGEVELGANVEPPHLHVWIRDTGPGIAPELQAHIFKPFVTGKGDSQTMGGIGLGLSITHHLVTLHGGSLWVESKPGKGSTFHIRIPLPTLETSRPALDTSALPVLLLISNLAPPAAEIIELSQRQGVEIQAISHRDDPEDILAHAQPMAVAWDLSNAHPNDWGLVRRLRHYPGVSRAPFILYGQARTSDAVSTQGLPVGPTGFVTKPSDRQSLLDVLNAICPAGAGRPILIVDDDPQALAAHESIVRYGLPDSPIRTASDGKRALEIMAREAPALVLLDLVMPEMDGFDLLDSMRGDERLRQVPVIILSNKVLNLDDLKRLEMHAQVTYQSKGLWSDEETVAALNRALFGEDALPPHTSSLVKRAIIYLNQNYVRSLSRWEIAEAVGVSEDYLSRVFARELGITAWDYLNRYRVLQAKRLLLQTHESIGNIARQTGFKDQAYFSRVFHKLNGISPQAFREGQ
ncbi:MAG: ATP-binding protein [Chloroflexota bacterium]